jgi:hypothetical protein
MKFELYLLRPDTMITHVDIANFGSFQSFVWRNSVKDPTGNVSRS